VLHKHFYVLTCCPGSLHFGWQDTNSSINFCACRKTSGRCVPLILFSLLIPTLDCSVGPTPMLINPLTPNDHYIGRTAPLTSKRCILYIFSTNIGTEYFKRGICSLFSFSLQNAVCFIILTYLVPVYSHFIYRMC
jgi:hypothetical protein